ncbi:MAG: exodeoxyribonuclease VII large subunit [Candidatus Aenigmatarchaeota archaeon]
MKDEKLYKISLAASVIGLILLFTFSHITSPETKEVSEVDPGNVGSRVEVSGTVEEKYVTQDGHLFFHVKENNDEINVAMFNDNLQSMAIEPDYIQEGQKVTVAGDVEMYEGELQILPVELEVR